MKMVENQKFNSERDLFQSREIEVKNCEFYDGESPLKESLNIKVISSKFAWKYPIWYSNNVEVNNCLFLETARSGIWYTNNLNFFDNDLRAPKYFRRCNNIKITNCKMFNALETLWNSQNIFIKDCEVKGDYFGFNSSFATIENLHLEGNYFFDGGKNIKVYNSRLISKDAFWNCENVYVKDSYIDGEYLGWNSKNVTFENCTITSLQGLCYMQNVKLINCKLINTTLAFEYSSVDAEIINVIDSVFNPLSGKIIAKGINELTLDETKIDPSKTEIIIKG